MATHRKKPKIEKATCNFCENKVGQIDYKDAETLKNYLSDYGRITPRYINGNCARHQRMMAHAIKLARFMAMLPYVGAVHGDE